MSISKSRSMRDITFFMGLALVFVLGAVRLMLENTGPGVVSTEEAEQWAECLDATIIPASEAIAVTKGPMPSSTSVASPPNGTLEFTAHERIVAQLADATPLMKSDTQPTTLQPGAVLIVANGRFELRDGTAIVHRANAVFLLKGGQSIRLGSAGNNEYRITLTKEATLEWDDKTPMLPAGTVGRLALDATQPVALTTLQPLSVAPWLAATTSTLLPVRTSGQRGLDNVTVEAREPGLRFDNTDIALNGCAWRREVNSRIPLQIGIAETRAGQPGEATILLTLPTGTLGTFTEFLRVPIQIVVADARGAYVGFGGFTAFDRGWSGLLATGFTLALFGWLASIRMVRAGLKDSWTHWLVSLFVGADGQPSLSLLQIFIWTVVTVWGLAYVYFVTGSLLSLTQEMMWLLAISGTGSVLARWISERAPNAEAAVTKGQIAAPGNRSIDFADLLTTNNRFDLLKLQLLVFTLLIASYVVWRIMETAAFPVLDTNTLLLLGVSQGTYIGGKLSSSTALNRAQVLKLDIDLKGEAIASLKTQRDELTEKRTDLEQSAVRDQAKVSDLTTRINALDAQITVAEKDLEEKKKSLERIVKEELQLIAK